MTAKLFCSYLPHISVNYRQQIATIAEMGYKVCELQAEFWETTRTKAGRVYSPDNTPPAHYLAQQGVECWAYVSPFWLESEAALGSLRDTGKDDDAYWFKRSLTRAVTENDWWLRDKNGNVCMGIQLYPLADITNDECRDFMVTSLIAHPAKRLRFDNGMVRQMSYMRPFAPRVTQHGLLSALMDIYMRVRAAGKQVVVNGGWEMHEPDDKPWMFPLYDVVDGVMVEWPTGFQNNPWWSLQMTHLPDLAVGWKGKRVVLYAPYTLDGYKRSAYGSYVEHARAFASIAETYGWWLATGMEQPKAAMSGRVWSPADWLPTETEEPPSDRLAVLEKRVDVLETRLDALTSQLTRALHALSTRQTEP